MFNFDLRWLRQLARKYQLSVTCDVVTVAEEITGGQVVFDESLNLQLSALLEVLDLASQIGFGVFIDTGWVDDRQRLMLAVIVDWTNVGILCGNVAFHAV